MLALVQHIFNNYNMDCIYSQGTYSQGISVTTNELYDHLSTNIQLICMYFILLRYKF